MNEKEMGSRWVERGTPKGAQRDIAREPERKKLGNLS